MGAHFKPVGEAVASAKGHYPTGDGRHRTVLPGERFTVFEGLTQAKWFDLVGAKSPAPVAATAPAAPEPDTLAAAAGVERKRRASVKPPTADEIA